MLTFMQQKVVTCEKLLVYTTRHIKCGKYVRVGHIFGGRLGEGD